MAPAAGRPTALAAHYLSVKRHMNLRILLTFPAAIIGWISAVIFGLITEGVRARLFCPTGMREGSDCYALGWESFPLWLIYSAIALSAVLSISLVALVAPYRKYEFSRGYYVLGAILASVLAILLNMYVAGLLALIFGAVTVFTVQRLTSKGNPTQKDARLL